LTWLSDGIVEHLREAAAWPELDPRYTITGVAGRGGMGTVFQARDAVLDRDVAVKVLDVADRQGARAARLTREAHILARLDHPGIVPVHDAGILPDGRPFYVMKLVRGRRFDETLAGAALGERLDVFARVLDAVAFAHEHGVVHRDLKPENIMVGRFGEAYVMDWGVAQDRARDAEAAVVGTPGFMPPEQEEAGAAVDGRADVFALGVILAHLAGGDAPRPLAAIANRARHQDPQARYQSAHDLARDVSRFRNQEPVEAYRESPGERLVRVYRRYELPALLVLAYVLMRAGLLIWKGF
jgi:eukaryotic-like serine/threonine-protein kinase